jgi:hypothetical protein
MWSRVARATHHVVVLPPYRSTTRASSQALCDYGFVYALGRNLQTVLSFVQCHKFTSTTVICWQPLHVSSEDYKTTNSISIPRISLMASSTLRKSPQRLPLLVPKRMVRTVYFLEFLPYFPSLWCVTQIMPALPSGWNILPLVQQHSRSSYLDRLRSLLEKIGQGRKKSKASASSISYFLMDDT